MSALWIGFTGLLLLMAALAADSGRVFRKVTVTSAALRRESRERDALLDRLRADIYRTETVIRDYLLERDATRAQSQKEELNRVRADIEQTLAAYERDVPESEKVALQELRDSVTSYRQSLAPSLLWDGATRRRLGEEVLRDIVIPRGIGIVQLSAKITALNERDLDAGEQRVEAVQAHFRARVTIISVIALLVGSALAGGIMLRVQRLERHAEARYEEVKEARLELRKLSERLVAAQEEERRILSRELHDEIGQAMSATLVELGRLDAAPPDSEARRQGMASVRRMVEDSVGMVRNMALLLRPSMLDDLGLIPALKWQARETTRRTGLRVKIFADDIAEDLPDSHRTCVYRVVQEALNNSAKHSQSTEVRVTVRRQRDGLFASVEDDGIGFDPREEKGMGLLGIEERVARLGGMFRIESQRGRGTVLSIRLPLAAEGRDVA